MSSDIAVITPTLNSEDKIRTFFDLLYKQKYGGEISVIIVDGGSEDSTIDISKEYDCQIFVEKGSDPYSAMNIGLSNSSTKYVWHLDSDNFLVDDKTAEKLVYPLDNDDSINIAFPLLELPNFFKGFLRFISQCEKYNQTKVIEASKAVEDYFIIDKLPLPVPNASILRRSTLNSIGGFFNDYLMTRMLQNKFLSKTAIVPTTSYIHDQRLDPILYIKKWRRRISIYANDNWILPIEKKDLKIPSPMSQINMDLIDNLSAPIRTSFVSLRELAASYDFNWFWGLINPVIVGMIVLSAPIDSIKTFRKIRRNNAW